MSEGFSRTLQTADDAEGIARLLMRAAERLTGLHNDRLALASLAERYRDYAAALRETAADGAPMPEPDQVALL